MKATELKELGGAELATKLTELREERFRLGFRAATESLENPMRLRAIRRDIARIETILRERALGGSK